MKRERDTALIELSLKIANSLQHELMVTIRRVGIAFQDLLEHQYGMLSLLGERDSHVQRRVLVRTHRMMKPIQHEFAPA
jgi:hypothetical protein